MHHLMTHLTPSYQRYHLTKFCILRALKTKTAEEVATHLFDIFCTFGAPSILHSDNGKEFVNNIIKALAASWPELKLVRGKPRNSQSQGSVERANRDVQNMIATWLKDNKTAEWSKSLRPVQFMKNRAHHRGIGMSPYKAMFGMEPRVGLTTSSIPAEAIATIQDEEELEQLLQRMK
nr:PREDICTED: KRAB-A domain-containing protein 2-like [Bemisia tabaci]